MTLATERAGLLISTGEQPSPVPFLICGPPDAGAHLLVAALRRWDIGFADSSSGDEGPPAGPPEEVARRLLVQLDAVDSELARGAVIGWDDFGKLVLKPDAAATEPSHPHRRRSRPTWRNALEDARPGLRYIHFLKRSTDDRRADQLARFRAEDWNWIGYFAWARTEPLTVTYEDLLADESLVVARVLALLQLEDLSPDSSGRHPTDLTEPAERVPVPPSHPEPVTQLSAPHPEARPAAHRVQRRPSVSIVVVSHNEGEKLPLTINGIRATVSDDVEIIVVDDCSTDDSVAAVDPACVRVVTPAVRGGVTGARNLGAARAQGDIVVFADAHVDPSPGWLDALCAALSDSSVGCAGPTITQIHERYARGHGFTWRQPQLQMAWLRSADPSTHEVPFLCGCLMAFRRADFESVGGFDPGMLRWGSEDAEICLHLRRRGQASVVVPGVEVAHLFRPRSPYEVPPHLVVHNALRLATTHLPPSAVSSVINAYKDLPTFPLAYAQLVDSDVWQRREWISGQARHDGAWFLDYFRIRALERGAR